MSDLVAKVKEPKPDEHSYFREDLVLFWYLHLASDARLTDSLPSSDPTAYRLVGDVLAF